MIAVMAISASISAGTHAYPSRGESETAKYVSGYVYDQRKYLKNSVFFGMKINKSFEELQGVFEDCQNENWDGFQARPVTEETYDMAERFIEAIPLGIPGPSVGAEPDGQITLEWYRSPHQILSVSVSQDSLLHYAALLGTKKAYGTEPFVGDVPERILNLISEATTA
jgi:hypothetical protein